MSIFYLQQQAREIFLKSRPGKYSKSARGQPGAIFPKSYLSGIPDKINRSGRLPGVRLQEVSLGLHGPRRWRPEIRERFGINL